MSGRENAESALHSLRSEPKPFSERNFNVNVQAEPYSWEVKLA